MTRHRAAIAAVLALLALPGCRAMSVGGLDRPAIGTDPVLDETTREVVDAINANARGVQSLWVKTSIKITSPGRGAASGVLMMQRPRDFKLVLRSRVAGDVANLGSNADGIWFWNREDPSVYTCKYDPDGNLPAGIPVTMQPEWIVEALGLREISDDEAKTLKASRGEVPGTWILRGKRPAGNGQSFATETVVNSETKRILSYKILAPDRKTVLTRAELGDYRVVAGNPDSEGGQTILPGRVSLSWVREKLSLDVGLNLNDARVNETFPEAQFTIQMPNAPRRDLAAMAATAPAGDAPSTIRESRPMPPISRGRAPRIFFKAPVPIDESETTGRPGDAQPLDADLPALPGSPSASSGLVTPPYPQPMGDPTSGVLTRESRRPAWVGAER